ncbi:hypothetical protein [Actinoplanes sp. NPDC049118]|uniref:hypothetical protein n=1 Tax=Actinoplanes sp. NPDC049118 TaxID=3155769 RepID=UPI00340DFD1F
MSDLGQERLVDKLLAHLEENGSDERLRELAAGIRNGSAGWAQSLNASFYAEAMQPGLIGFTEWYDQLSESERAEHAERCQRDIDALQNVPQPYQEGDSH